MKVAILSESPADEAAIRILVDAILGEGTQHPPRLSLRARGWPAVVGVLPSVLRHLHYHTDAEALVVVADADDSPLHTPEHEDTSAMESSCRWCMLHHTIGQVTETLRPVAGRATMRTAVGVAVPAIEAWYLVGRDQRVRESSFDPADASHPPPYTRSRLKKLVYGTDRPPLVLETRRATEEAQRLTDDLSALEDRFPVGFGTLAQDIRDW